MRGDGDVSIVRLHRSSFDGDYSFRPERPHFILKSDLDRTRSSRSVPKLPQLSRSCGSEYLTKVGNPKVACPKARRVRRIAARGPRVSRNEHSRRWRSDSALALSFAAPPKVGPGDSGPMRRPGPQTPRDCDRRAACSNCLSQTNRIIKAAADDHYGDQCRFEARRDIFLRGPFWRNSKFSCAQVARASAAQGGEPEGQLGRFDDGCSRRARQSAIRPSHSHAASRATVDTQSKRHGG